jgi:hypothetical protein
MTDNPGTHVLASGPRARFIGQSLRALAAFDEGAGYLRWAANGGGTFSAEDLEAIRGFLRVYRKPTAPPTPPRPLELSPRLGKWGRP